MDEWLSTFVDRRLRDLDGEEASWLDDDQVWPDAYGEVIPLERRRWQ